MEDDKVRDVSSLVKYLKRWYWKFGRREIWWRKTRLTPYEVFVIETFLWKTRAESVVELTKKFLQEFPDVRSLARSSTKQLEAKFSNLGLQKRKSELLLRAANYIVEKCDGEFPKTYEELVKIPGIGQYLANAILCFAFDQPTIPVDVNVKRVIEKFFKINIKNVRKIDKNISDILKEIGIAWGNFKEAAWCLIDFGSQLASTKKNSAQIKKEISNC